MKSLRFMATAFCCALIAKTAVAEAAHLRPRTDESALEAKHRLALAEAQRTLVEEISEASCLVAMGVDQATYGPMIETLVTRYDQVAVGLRVGDPSLGITGEEDASKVIRALDSSDAVWAPFKAAASKLVSTGEAPDDLAETLFEGDKIILEELSKLIVAVETAYSHPAEMMLGQAITLDIAARQQVLTQAIGKDMCLLVLGWRVEEHRKSLETSLSTFMNAHEALLNGMPAAGLKPAPTPEIRAALEGFMAEWSKLRPAVDAAIAGEALSRDDLSAFIKQNIALLKDLEAIVLLYEKI